MLGSVLPAVLLMLYLRPLPGVDESSSTLVSSPKAMMRVGTKFDCCVLPPPHDDSRAAATARPPAQAARRSSFTFDRIRETPGFAMGGRNGPRNTSGRRGAAE